MVVDVVCAGKWGVGFGEARILRGVAVHGAVENSVDVSESAG